MHDLKWIRDNPEVFDAGLERRGLEPQAEMLVSMDVRHREAVTRLQELRTERNELSKQVGEVKKKGGDASDLIAQVSTKKEEMTQLESEQVSLANEIENVLLRIPNIPDESVPYGLGEDDNVEIRRHGKPRQFSFTPKDHVALGETLGDMDFETAAGMSGSRFVVLYGLLARLERALAQFMLNSHVTESGYTEVAVPLLVNDKALIGTGQLPKFGEDQYRTQDELWLIPTAEVPLSNLVANKILSLKELPLRYTAFTPCFRREAGAAGKDTRGMIRQHQFEKVEMVSIVAPEDSEDELSRMVGCAENILKRLKLPYRVMELSTGDIGFGAARTFDLEVWLPAQNCYREISSCSNCQDFQALRMGTRFKSDDGSKGTRPVHTLNGSGLAVGRTLVAVLENYQKEDGSVVIPEVLQPYMDGIEMIAPR
ncbi:MAG: serine--tRNA ligase [Rhodospirillaceae bacterium]